MGEQASELWPRILNTFGQFVAKQDCRLVSGCPCFQRYFQRIFFFTYHTMNIHTCSPLTVKVNEILDESWKMLKAMQQFPHCPILLLSTLMLQDICTVHHLFATDINRDLHLPFKTGRFRTLFFERLGTRPTFHRGRLPNLMWLNLASNCISSLPPEGELQGLQARFVGRNWRGKTLDEHRTQEGSISYD